MGAGGRGICALREQTRRRKIGKIGILALVFIIWSCVVLSAGAQQMSSGPSQTSARYSYTAYLMQKYQQLKQQFGKIYGSETENKHHYEKPKKPEIHVNAPKPKNDGYPPHPAQQHYQPQKQQQHQVVVHPSAPGPHHPPKHQAPYQNPHPTPYQSQQHPGNHVRPEYFEKEEAAVGVAVHHPPKQQPSYQHPPQHAPQHPPQHTSQHPPQHTPYRPPQHAPQHPSQHLSSTESHGSDEHVIIVENDAPKDNIAANYFQQQHQPHLQQQPQHPSHQQPKPHQQLPKPPKEHQNQYDVAALKAMSHGDHAGTNDALRRFMIDQVHWMKTWYPNGYGARVGGGGQSSGASRYVPDIPSVGSFPMCASHLECARNEYCRTVQSPDGSCNNMRHPLWGMAKTPQRRYSAPRYHTDGSTPAEYHRKPSARSLSNIFSVDTCNDCMHGQQVSPITGCHPDPQGASAMLWQFGQLIDHDIILSPPSSLPDFLNIPIPHGDPCFRKHEIEMIRSNFTIDSRGARQQMNFISSFIDASFLYGSSSDETVKLRSGVGGRMLTSMHNGKEMLPHTQPSVGSEFDRVGRERTMSTQRNALVSALSKLTFQVNVSPHIAQHGGSIEVATDDFTKSGGGGGINANSRNGRIEPHTDTCVCAVSDNKRKPHKSRFEFLAGDVRANEQLGLTSLHTLFLREHNRIADMLVKLLGSSYTDDYDEVIFQLARRRVIAEVQVITWKEWLPIMIGKEYMRSKPHMHRYTYNPSIEPSVSNEFGILYRVGHSMIQRELLRLDPRSFRPSHYGNEPLREAFFQPQKLLEKGGIEPLIAGLLRQRTQRVDPAIVEDLRSFLFTEEIGSAGFDLAAFNIQRGRDHGLPSYLDIRRSMGLNPRVDRVISPSNVARLHAAYGGDMEAIDPWLGSLIELPARGAMVGELLQKLLGDDFNRLRMGDRFWYEKILQNHNDYGEMGMGYLGVLLGAGLPLEHVEDTTLAKLIAANTDVAIDPNMNAFYGL